MPIVCMFSATHFRVLVHLQPPRPAHWQLLLPGGDFLPGCKFVAALHLHCLLRCMKPFISALQVVKLSDAVQPLPRQTTQFIHGVPQQFLAVGDKKKEPAIEGQERFSKGAYFMGKAVWAKGYTELLSLLESHRSAGKVEYPIDCYGNGEDLASVS